MPDNPHAFTYAPHGRRSFDRAYTARHHRWDIATTRRYTRATAIEAREYANEHTVECVVAWLNDRFGGEMGFNVVADLPQGMIGDEHMCPIAMAIVDLLDLDYGVAVDGDTVSLPNGDVYEVPVCASRFVRLFDAGYFPQYVDPIFDTDEEDD
jgi:hypothetical protein